MALAQPRDGALRGVCRDSQGDGGRRTGEGGPELSPTPTPPGLGAQGRGAGGLWSRPRPRVGVGPGEAAAQPRSAQPCLCSV